MRTRLLSSSDPVPSSGAVQGQRHTPVLLHEVVEALEVVPGDIVVDATLGGAGHAKELVKGLRGNGLFLGFDQDAEAIERAQVVLEGSGITTHLIAANFRDCASVLEKRGVTRITKVLFDLGWSSYQLDSGRGFSFLKDEPLLMTYARPSSGREDTGMLTARAILNTWSEKTLADVIFGFGEERYSRRIAKAIVEHRVHSPLRTSRELAEVIRGAVPSSYRRGRIHPATRTFQALRIAVNDELGALKEGLLAAWRLLAPGGRIAVISFHSGEDRIVKQTFSEWKKAGEGRLLTKKPRTPTSDEIRKNPRARSAKLRVIEKLVQKEISYENSDSKDK